MITRITGKNQVTVPASIVAQAKLGPGTRLDWEVAEEGVLIVHVLPDQATLASRLRGSGKKHRKQGGSAVANLIEERDRENREQR